MMHATLSSKFQISIPKEVRTQLNLQPGNKVGFLQVGKQFYFSRIPSLDELKGCMKGAPAFERDRSDRLDRYKTIKPARKTA